MKVRSWMSALETERLERKTEDIRRRARLCDGSWEGAYFVTIARNYGFGINGDAMEQWALSVPLNDVGHHRDNAFQVEAFFMGQAGLLDTASMPERHRQAAIDDDYFQRLQHEYAYLAHKFQLTPSTTGCGASSACVRRTSHISALPSWSTSTVSARPV